MTPEGTARPVRVGGVDVAPGRTAAVTIGVGLPPGWPLVAHVVAGVGPGPRVGIVGAPRGFEQGPALAIDRLLRELDPARLRGAVVAVPVARPAGRLSKAGRPLAPLPLPGDTGGGPRARLAFALHADVVVGCDLLLRLEAPPRPRNALLVAAGRTALPEVRRLARAAGVAGLVDDEDDDSFARAAAAHGRLTLALSVATAEGTMRDGAVLAEAVERLLAALGMWIAPGPMPRGAGPIVSRRTLVVCPAQGRLEEVAFPGQWLRRGGRLARVCPLGGGPAVELVAPHEGIVLEAPAIAIGRKGQPLFLVGRAPVDAARAVPPTPASVARPPRTARTTLGWVERVSLPRLGLRGLQAKIDTGARTSALHVLEARAVAGRARIRIVLAGRGPRAARTRELPIREYVDVRDTSGRQERRPVVETTLALGASARRIRLTLTNRGDMRYPILVGRTALGPDVLVDPSRRFLLGKGPVDGAFRSTAGAATGRGPSPGGERGRGDEEDPHGAPRNGKRK